MCNTYVPIGLYNIKILYKILYPDVKLQSLRKYPQNLKLRVLNKNLIQYSTP